MEGTTRPTAAERHEKHEADARETGVSASELVRQIHDAIVQLRVAHGFLDSDIESEVYIALYGHDNVRGPLRVTTPEDIACDTHGHSVKA